MISRKRQTSGIARTWIPLLFILCSIAGCRGCQITPTANDGKSESESNEKPSLPRLELTSLQSLPAASESEGLVMKPGHWYEMQQSVRANESDEALLVSCAAIERAFPFRPIPPAGLDESLSFERRISLARGQRKQLTLEMFLPRIPGGGESKKASIRASYLPRMLGAAVQEGVYPVTTMPDYQYYFVVLSQNPARFQFLNGLSSVVWPTVLEDVTDPINPFRVVQISQSDVQSSLPTRLTTWTSTSHLMWNDCDASALLERQQSALVDWLHFGGQLIVNGPESQASLKNCFLSDYLPLTNVRAGQYEEDRWKKFSDLWSIARFDEKATIGISLPNEREPPLIEGELAPGARWVNGCEGLVAERFVGGGRVVMTTFSLGDSMMIRWPSLSSFFNGALLHRPSRVWQETGSLGGELVFAGKQKGAERDPSYVSRVRLMGRDLGSSVPRWSNPKSNQTFRRGNSASNSKRDKAVSEAGVTVIHNQGFAEIENDSAFGIGKIALAALQEASGIQVPRVKTILQLLIGYLVVLVPLNWLVFRTIGRVELAWLAAPCIAIIGAIVVARSVQLDIGFSRSQSTMNLVELKSGYPRGHLSSYVSLYTSLSTRYQARYPSNEGILMPVGRSEQNKSLTQVERKELRYNFAEEAGAGLSAFPVRSNSTSFLKGEEIHDAEGALSIVWDEADSRVIRFRNTTHLSLHGVGVVAKAEDGDILAGWIGELDQQADGQVRMTVTLQSTPVRDVEKSRMKPLFEQWDAGLNSLEEQPAGTKAASNSMNALATGRILASVQSQHVLSPREILLVGWTDVEISHLEIEPKASQRLETSIVVVRNDGEEASEIAPDLNLPPKMEQTELPFEPSPPETPESNAAF
jgi:hypothetical protein